MSRLDCLDGTQRFLIEAALSQSPADRLAEVCRVHPRTLKDWWREKHRMPHDCLKRISKEMGLIPPRRLRLVPDFWHIPAAARLGGKRRAQLYGPPGTLESRRKGGRISCERFRANPDLAQTLGFTVRKVITRPRKSALLAEFIGIMLGDGCLSSQFQVGIAFNSETDRAYGAYLQDLFQRLFTVSATIQSRSKTRGWTVVASSRALVEHLQVLGLVRGNKVANQVDAPKWIWAKPSYQRACLRGLMDTDGSVYRYAHRVYGHRYHHVGLCFTNHSRPLLLTTARLLKNCGFHPRAGGYHVSLYRQEEVRRYFRLVGSQNLKHVERFQEYCEDTRDSRRGAGVVDPAALEKR